MRHTIPLSKYTGGIAIRYFLPDIYTFEFSKCQNSISRQLTNCNNYSRFSQFLSVCTNSPTVFVYCVNGFSVHIEVFCSVCMIYTLPQNANKDVETIPAPERSAYPERGRNSPRCAFCFPKMPSGHFSDFLCRYRILSRISANSASPIAARTQK